MAQFARPDGNITQTGFTGGFAEIDEAVASDADFAWGANNTAAVLEVSLGNVSDPGTSSGHTVRYRVVKTNGGTIDGAGNAVTVTVELYQGGTLIAADAARTATGTVTGYAFTLTGTQADAITDYTDLRLRFTTSASGGNPSNRRGGAVTWTELEVPDAAVVYTFNAEAGSFASETPAGSALAQRLLPAMPATFALTGLEATFTLTGGAASFDLVASPGAFTLTAPPASLLAVRSVGALPGAFLTDGLPASLVSSRRLAASPAAFATSGFPAQLLYDGNPGQGDLRRRFFMRFAQIRTE